MKARNYILLLVVSLIGTACERTLDFVETGETEVSNITLNAFAITGTPLKIFVNKAYPVSQVPEPKHYDIRFAYSTWGYEKDSKSFDYKYWDYYKMTALYDAELKAVVNGQDIYSFTLTPDSIGFVCDYVPQEGDHIMLSASYGGEKVSAETTVPANPKIEIMENQELNTNPYREHDGMEYNSNTLLRITCCITDAGGEQYYRLRVRNESDAHNWSRVNDGPTHEFSYYWMEDIFFSDDALFVDNRLNANFGGWPPLFSNVFDNSILRGKEYSFIVNSPKYEHNSSGMTEYEENKKVKEGHIEHGPIVMVELQALSYDLYRYLKSVELYRITSSDAYAEPVYIYSNVQNGWGIFGALSYDRHFVEYGE